MDSIFDLKQQLKKNVEILDGVGEYDPKLIPMLNNIKDLIDTIILRVGVDERHI